MKLLLISVTVKLFSLVTLPRPIVYVNREFIGTYQFVGKRGRGCWTMFGCEMFAIERVRRLVSRPSVNCKIRNYWDWWSIAGASVYARETALSAPDAALHLWSATGNCVQSQQCNARCKLVNIYRPANYLASGGNWSLSGRCFQTMRGAERIRSFKG